MRITKVNGTEGNFGEAVIAPDKTLSSAPADLLGAHIRSETLGDVINSATIQCIAPDGEVICTLTLGDMFSEVRPNPNEPTHTPVPTTRSTATPDAAQPLQSIALSIQDKPVKYSHYNAYLNFHVDQLILLARFRYHDPLPHGTNLRLTAVNGIPGTYAEAPILTVDHQANRLLIAELLLTDLPNAATTFTLAAYAPDAEEPIFEVTLTSTQPATGFWSGGIWHGPDGETYKPASPPAIPTPYNPYPQLPEIDLFPGENVRPDTSNTWPW